MRFLAKLLKHWYLYLIPVLLLPAAGALYGKQKLSVYETSALLYIYSSDTVAGANTQFNQYVSPAQNGSDLINEYMQSNNFVVTIAESTDLRRQYDLTDSADKDIVVQRIRGDVLVNPTGVAWGNNVTLLVDDKDPQLAKQIAQAVISVTVSQFGTRRLEYDKNAETFLAQQRNVALAQLAKDTKVEADYFAIHPDANFPDGHDPYWENLQTLVVTDQAAVTNLTDRIKALQLDEAAQTADSNNVFTVMDYPQLPLRPTLHLKGLIPYFGGGLAAALALILLIVGTRTVLDRKVYSTRDLRNITEELELDIPLLTEIPVLKTLTRSNRRQHGDDDVLSGVLVPILTVLPQSSTEVLNHEIRSAVGVSVMDDD